MGADWRRAGCCPHRFSVHHAWYGGSARAGVGGDGRPVAADEPAFPLSVAMLTGATLLPGNRVEIALNGDGTYERLWADLRSARESITLQLYYGHRGQMAATLRQILLDRAAGGVRVHVLYDAFGSSRIPRRDRDSLRQAGVVIVPFRPIRLSALHLAQNRSHVRGIVVDGRIGWTGGFGIDDKWLGDGRTNGSWRERACCQLTTSNFQLPKHSQPIDSECLGRWALGVDRVPRPVLRPAVRA